MRSSHKQSGSANDDLELQATLPVNLKHPPGMLIAAESNPGHAYQEVTSTSTNPLDEASSRIWGKRTAAFYHEGKNTDHPDESADDKITIGYTTEGLPFQIVVKGKEHGRTNARDAIFAFTNQTVTPLIALYAEQLSESDQPEEVMNKLIRAIYAAIPSFQFDLLFSMSIAITYSKNNALYCAGFGIGNTGLVLLEREQSQYLPLAPTMHLSRHHSNLADTFDLESTLHLDNIIARNTIFNESITEGDEIFGYTYLLPDLFVDIDPVSELRETSYPSILKKVDLVSYCGEASLFDSVKAAHHKLFEKRCEEAKNDNQASIFGDDCLLGTAQIPSMQTRRHIQYQVFRQEAERLRTTLEKKDGDIKKKGEDVYHKIMKLAESASDYTELTRDLIVCHRALSHPTNNNIQNLHRRAQHAREDPSTGRMILAGALIILGATLTMIGACLIAGGVGALPTGIFSAVGVAGIYGGSVIGATGISLIGSGIGLWAKGYHRKASANEMNQLTRSLTSASHRA